MKGLVEVKCKEADFDPSSGIVTWLLDTPDGDRVAMYHVSDLASAINLSGNATNDDWVYFCSIMRGKKFKIVFEDSK